MRYTFAALKPKLSDTRSYHWFDPALWWHNVHVRYIHVRYQDTENDKFPYTQKEGKKEQWSPMSQKHTPPGRSVQQAGYGRPLGRHKGSNRIPSVVRSGGGDARTCRRGGSTGSRRRALGFTTRDRIVGPVGVWRRPLLTGGEGKKSTPSHSLSNALVWVSCWSQVMPLGVCVLASVRLLLYHGFPQTFVWTSDCCARL